MLEKVDGTAVATPQDKARPSLSSISAKANVNRVSIGVPNAIDVVLLLTTAFFAASCSGPQTPAAPPAQPEAASEAAGSGLSAADPSIPMTIALLNKGKRKADPVNQGEDVVLNAAFLSTGSSGDAVCAEFTKINRESYQKRFFVSTQRKVVILDDKLADTWIENCSVRVRDISVPAPSEALEKDSAEGMRGRTGPKYLLK